MIQRILVAAALALAGSLCAQGDQPKAAAVAPAKAAFEQRAPLYPIATCIVSGEDLDADAVTFTADGTTFKTCCAKCQKKVEKDPATFKAKLEEASKKAQLAHYPLATCPISGEKLGGMGDPVQIMLEGTLVQLCCKNCVKKANAAAHETAGKVIAAAYEAQRASYPSDTCPVSGEKLDKDAIDVMFGTTLVRTCCAKCAQKLEADPVKYASKLPGAAAPAEHGKEHEKDHEKEHGKEHGEGHGDKHDK